MRKIQIHRKRLEWKILIMAGIFFWIGSIWLSSSYAAVREVCKEIGCTYTLPSEAVAAAAAGDTILIRSGTYMEPGLINITVANLKIIGDDPTNTIVQNSVLSSVFVLTSAADNIEIANLTITGGRHGIGFQVGSAGAVIHHNIIRNNGKSGISTEGSCCGYSFIAFNNVVHGNNEYGIAPYGDDSIIYNNIVFKNVSYGIINGTASYNSSYDNVSTGSLLSSNFYSTIGNIDNISQNCLFENETAQNFRLQSTSPCKDKGNPGYLDVDGTRSDMGSFGGPAAARFWPYWDGGPVITDLIVDPVYVPRGGTISITATGEIR